MSKSISSSLTHKRILYIAVPVVLSNATVPILGAVDTAVVGQLGQAVPIGAVGIGAIIITSIFWLFTYGDIRVNCPSNWCRGFCRN